MTFTLLCSASWKVFDDEYKPTKLRNWEIPKWYPERAIARKGSTKTISNEKGLLLPGVPRSTKSPWGNYKGTWDLPKKITREIANQLSAPDPDEINNWYKRYSRAPDRLPLVNIHQPETLKQLVRGNKTTAKPKKIKSAPAEKLTADTVDKQSLKLDPDSCRCDLEDVNKDANEDQAVKLEQEKMDSKVEHITEKEIERNSNDDERKKKLYIPGDYTDAKQRHPSYDFLIDQAQNEKVLVESKGYPKYREDFSRPCKSASPSIKEKFENFYDKHKKMMCEHIRRKISRTDNNEAKAPYVAASKNFALAKKLHKENLEHVPLPDTITDALYRKKQLDKECHEPGLLLKDGNYATGVGWKGYPGYGANRCTKLRIFRPKTSTERPPSVCSFDKKWRFIRQHKVTPIDLAIYWDMTPINPAHEPKRPYHIDGSAFSAGPAVFHNVHRNCNEDGGSSSDLSNKNALFTNLAQTERPKTSWEKGEKHKHANEQADLRRAKSAANLCAKSTRSSSTASTRRTNLESRKDFYQSTPNLSHDDVRELTCLHPCLICQQPKFKVTHTKFCEACELKAKQRYDAKIQAARPKSDFKMAFKAGVPNNQSKGKRDDYPEHWRLASVYQHSYKPVHTRKRPLLATVYQ